jgi:diguanylate cyclase (GGDEF)-like protein
MEHLLSSYGLIAAFIAVLGFIACAAYKRYRAQASKSRPPRDRTGEEIRDRNSYDALTGLPNRHMFDQILARHIREAERTGETLAVLLVALGRFKMINDWIGHEMGDLMLKQVTERLQSCLAADEVLSRQGGDEFLLLLKRRDREAVRETAQRFLALLAEPFTLGNNEAYISASIGISLYPQDGRDVGELIKNADAAMLYAKQMGGSNLQFYSREQNQKTQEQLQLEADLHKALQRGEFVLHYQPQVSLLTGKVTGAEALIRWVHPQKGVIAPADFIPLAEETGLIVPIGEWVLRTACRQVKSWHQQGFPMLVVSVNISAKQFLQHDLTRVVKEILEETGLPPQYLELELTESSTIDVNQASSVLHDLKKLGVRLSVDDFGTGYSSLNYIKSFPVDKLKIDKSFIRDIIHDTHDATIVKSIISMAHHLQLVVNAEGVETPAHLSFLKQHFCDEVQGFFVSKPLTPEEFIQRFADIERELQLAASVKKGS